MNINKKDNLMLIICIHDLENTLNLCYDEDYRQFL